MSIYVFDIDETLDVSGGPIKTDQLIKLRMKGHLIGLCGNWAAFIAKVKQWDCLISLISIAAPSKHEFLTQIKKYIPADRYIYIGNITPSNSPISDKDEAFKAGWEFIEEKDFHE